MDKDYQPKQKALGNIMPGDILRLSENELAKVVEVDHTTQTDPDNLSELIIWYDTINLKG